MVRLSWNTECEPIRRIVLAVADVDKFVKKEISGFVTSNTMQFFKRFEINTEFLKHDPSTWLDREDYKAAREMSKAEEKFAK